MSTTNFDFLRSGYSTIELITRTERTVVYRGVETDGQQRSVTIKLLVAAYPTHQEIIDFRHQYQISRHLDLDGVVRVYDLRMHDRGYALVMEDFGGISLASYAEMVKLSIEDIVAIAIQVTDILEAIGRSGIVHKDIKPANILINPATKQVKLIDFGIASLLPREVQPVVGPSSLAGTLAYMPPEQTGRMNRGVDYRSDFYALGATLYQLLTGKLPFDTQDPIELIHAHLAIAPRIVSEVNPEIPRALSQIVTKLMAKDADLRYQTAVGIKYDLLSYTADKFELGKGDICDRFTISERLYGRELEIHTLLAACERVAAGNSEMMLVAGSSGIGKTAVINEVHKPIARHHGYFIAGKFDQFDRHTPLSAFVSAFSDLVGQLLGENEDILARWRTQILAIVGENGGVLTAVIPELELIIGRQPKPVELEGTAVQNRFNWLFQKFVGIFTTAAHPLTIFLDDLQWADAASLEFIKVLMEEDRYLFLIGAYRDNEVSKIHPTIVTIERLRQSGKIVSTVTLKPLSIADTNRLVADTLKCTAKLAQPLTEFIYRKTQGNPFFITQFLTVLHRDGELKFNPSARGWECDMSQIQTLSITDDVVAFMAARLQTLPASSQSLLQLAACYGDRFDLHTLAIIADRSPVDTATDLWCALQQSLILPIDCTYKLYRNIDREDDLVDRDRLLPTAEYRFAHDRIQQAAYSLIPADRLQITQLNIGRLLLAKTPDFTNDNRSLKIVDLLNAGEPAITTSRERIQLMEMNLWAAKKAKANTADRAALDYSLQGIKLLGMHPWQQHYEYALALYEIAADAAYLTGDRHLNLYIDTVLEHAIDPLDRCGVIKTKILAAIGKGNLEMAIDLTINALAELDIKLNKQVDRATAAAEIIKTEAALIGKNLHEIDRRSMVVNRRILAAMSFLNLLVSTSYLVYPNLFVVVATQMVRLSLRHGNCDYSGIAYAIYGTLLVGGLQRIEAGIKYSKHALEILDKRTNDSLRSSAIFICMGSARAWDTSIRDIAARHREGYEVGLTAGNFEYAAWNLLTAGWSLYIAGEDLHTLHELATTNRQLIAALGQEVQFSFDNRFSQSISNLLGCNTDPLCFTSEYFDDRGFVENCIRSKYTAGIVMLEVEKLMLYYLFDDLENAKQASDRAHPYLEKVIGQLVNCVFHFYGALTLLEIDAKNGLAKPDAKKLGEHQQQIKKWAKYAPMNAQHKWELIEARRLQQLGDFVAAVELFDRAIAGAKLNKFQQEEAIANELAAKFYLAWGRDKIAATYMQEAYYGYAKWGAKAKTDDLEQRYPVLLAPILRNAVIEFDSISTLATLANTDSKQSSDAQKIENLDFISVMQSAQLLSSTIDIDELISILSDILIKCAGAQTCIVALPDRDDKWQLKSIANGSKFTPIDRDLTAELSDYPSNIIYWTKNSRSTFMGDGTNSLPVADLYLLDRQPRSILSLPIIKQEKVLGVVYLEHRDLPDLFTVDRQTVISFLANQVALALDNANLYLEAKVAKEQAQLQQNYFIALIDNIPHTAWLKDANDKYIAVNRTMANDLGCKTDDLIGKNELDLFPPELANSLLRIDRQIMATGERCTREEKIQLPTGKSIWVETSKTPIFSEDGTPLGIAGIAIDITERKLAAIALQASEQRYQQIVSHIPAAIYQMEFNTDGTYRLNYSSSRFAELFDLPADSPIPPMNEFFNIVIPEDRQGFYHSLQANPEHWEWEGRVMTSAGNLKWIRGESYGTWQEDGVLIRDGVLLDVTDRKQIEFALQQSESRYQQIVSNIPAAIYQVELDNDRGYRLNYTSTVFARMFDLPADSEIKDLLPIFEAVVPEDRESFQQSLAYTAVPWLWEGRIQTQAGQIKWVRAESQPLETADGRLYWDGVILDITDRKLAELALQASESRYQQIVSNIPAALFQFKLDANGEQKMNYVSSKFSDLLDLPNSTNLSEIEIDTGLLPEDRERFAESIAKSARTGEGWEWESQIVTSQGNYKWVRGESNPVYHDDGSIVWDGILLDITERKEIELALQASDRRYQQLADNLPVALYQFEMGADGRSAIKYVSSRMYDIFEIPPEVDFGSISIGEGVHPEDMGSFAESIAASAASGEMWVWEGRFMMASGDLKWIRCESMPTRKADGSILWDGILIDINHRKQIEIALANSESQFRGLVENSADLIYAIDLDGNFTYLSPQITDILGYEPAELLGTHCFQLVDEMDVATAQVAFASTIDNGGNRTEMEFQICSRDGSHRWIALKSSPARDENGTVTGIQGIGRDITGQKSIEILRQEQAEALRQSEARYQQLTDNLPGALYQFHLAPDGTMSYPYISSGCWDLFELTAAELMADIRHTLKMIPPEEIAEFHRSIVTSAKTLTSWSWEGRALLDSGKTKWIKCAARPERQPDGSVLWDGMMLDVTERKQADLALQASKQFLETILDSFPLLIFWKDRESNFLGGNQQFLSVTGRTSMDELIGKSDFDMPWSKEEAEAYRADDREVIDGEIAKLGIIETQTQIDGSTIWLETNKVPLRDPQGRVIGIVGTLQDVTDREQADIALKESKQFLETVLDSFPLYVFWKDRESKYLGGNQKFISAAGRTSMDELIGASDYDLPWSKEEAEAYRADDREVIDGEISKLGVIETQTQADGRLVWVETNKVPLHDPHGQVIGIVGTFQDVTDREIARLNLNLANDRLEQTVIELQRATKLKDEFLATMSHELRTPLNSVLGMSEALQEQVFGQLNPAQLKSLRTIDRSGRHLLSLINDILDLSKISVGKLELNVTDFSLSYLCTSSLSFVRQQAHTKQIEIEVSLPPTPITVRADERRLRQVAINLLSNAVKFTPAGGRISLVAKQIASSDREDDRRWLELSVTDTGIGIAASDIDRLCQPFTQLDSSLNRQYEGTGLGLALSKQIVELHGGSISIASQVGSGSCFTVRLPDLVTASNPSDLLAYSPPSDELDNGGSRTPASATILLVEDNEANIHTFASYLAAKGYHTLLANSGKQALEILATHSPDAIVMDIQMPEMDGIEAIDRIRNDLQLTSTPIIALTALAMTGDREKCLAAGADEYLTKPVRLKELAATIQQLLTPVTSPTGQRGETGERGEVIPNS